MKCCGKDVNFFADEFPLRHAVSGEALKSLLVSRDMVVKCSCDIVVMSPGQQKSTEEVESV